MRKHLIPRRVHVAKTVIHESVKFTRTTTLDTVALILILFIAFATLILVITDIIISAG